MSSDNGQQRAIELHAVSKAYRLYETPAQRMRELLFGGRRHTLFHALQSIDLAVTRGETLGVLGRNGAGKSTLLQMVAGTLAPTHGAVSVRGRVAALLELGSGFNMEFTGRENVRLYASIMGMTRQQIDARLPEILAFADIGRFADQPLKTYSSGMSVRLAFATVAHLDPDILIVDEALAVGDAQFQMKCMQRVNKMKSEGRTFLLASHSPDQIVSFCGRAIVLEQGKVVFDGAPKDAVHIYKALLFPGAKRGREEAEVGVTRSLAARDLGKTQISKSEARYGTGEVKIESIQLLSQDGQPTNIVASNESVTLRLRVRSSREIVEPVYGFRVRNVRGIDVYVKNTIHERITCPPLLSGEPQSVEISMVVSLAGGEYFLGAGVVEFVNGQQIILDRRLDVIQISVIRSDSSTGIANLNAKFNIQNTDEA